MDTQMVKLPLSVVEDLLALAKGKEQDTLDHAAVAFAELAIGPYTKDGEYLADLPLEEEITVLLRHAMFMSGWTDQGDRRAILDGSRDTEFGTHHPARVALRAVLESPDARITNLTRYNSEQVVQRRVIQAKLVKALQALQLARNTFRKYGKLHRAKDTVDASLKALRNDELADNMDAAMTFEPDPSDYGRP